MSVIQQFWESIYKKPVSSSTYIYRSLPCNVGKFCISGVDQENQSWGILEFCTDYTDAVQRLKTMKSYPQFQNLKIEKHG